MFPAARPLAWSVCALLLACSESGLQRRAPERPPEPATHAHTKPDPLPVCSAPDADPLDAARAFYDASRHEEALACAARASALFPDEPHAHSERAAALAALHRHDEAKLAYARALALDPEHP